jgi:hypothetical protein
MASTKVQRQANHNHKKKRIIFDVCRMPINTSSRKPFILPSKGKMINDIRKLPVQQGIAVSPLINRAAIKTFSQLRTICFSLFIKVLCISKCNYKKLLHPFDHIFQRCNMISKMLFHLLSLPNKLYLSFPHKSF